MDRGSSVSGGQAPDATRGVRAAQGRKDIAGLVPGAVPGAVHIRRQGAGRAAFDVNALQYSARDEGEGEDERSGGEAGHGALSRRAVASGRRRW